MSYLYKAIRLQSLRFITVGTLSLLIFGIAAYLFSPVISSHLFKKPIFSIDEISEKLLQKSSKDSTFQDALQLYQIDFNHQVYFEKVTNPEKFQKSNAEYFIAHIQTNATDAENSKNRQYSLLVRASDIENLHTENPQMLIGYIQPIKSSIFSKKESKEIHAFLTKAKQQSNSDINPNLILTTQEQSDLLGFTIFLIVMFSIAFIPLLHGMKLFLMPDRSKEFKFQRKKYYEDISLLSQNFDQDLKNNSVIRLPKADIFPEFIVIRESFRMYIIPLHSLMIIYPTKKFILHSLLWFIPKSGVAIYEEKRAYFARLPVSTIRQIHHYLEKYYPYIELHKNKNCTKHASNREDLWQEFHLRKLQYQDNIVIKDVHHA